MEGNSSRANVHWLGLQLTKDGNASSNEEAARVDLVNRAGKSSRMEILSISNSDNGINHKIHPSVRLKVMISGIVNSPNSVGRISRYGNWKLACCRDG